MHDGSLRTLKDVVAYYDRGGRLKLSAGEREDLVEFLKSLTADFPREQSAENSRNSTPETTLKGTRR
jgi:hypothetical protein